MLTTETGKQQVQVRVPLAGGGAQLPELGVRLGVLHHEVHCGRDGAHGSELTFSDAFL